MDVELGTSVGSGKLSQLDVSCIVGVTWTRRMESVGKYQYRWNQCSRRVSWNGGEYLEWIPEIVTRVPETIVTSPHYFRTLSSQFSYVVVVC